MKNPITFIALAVILLISSCAPEDDIKGIFVEKTWKMTNICTCKGLKDDGKPTLSVEEVDIAIQNGNFQILFKDGTFSGRGIKSTFSGKWSANSKDNTFNVTITEMEGTEDSDLGRRFVNLFQNSKYYMGDYLMLKLFDEDQKEYILFRPL